MKNLLKDKVAPQGADYTIVCYNSTDGSVSVTTPKPIPTTRWYNGDTLIKEIDVVGELSSTYKETACTKCEIGTNVTSIGKSAFSGCTSLTSITIPNSVKSVGEYAFRDCSGLTSVTMSNSVTSIGYSAFTMCTSLSSVTIPNSVTSIGYYAFKNCSGLTSVTIPNSITSISVGTFGGCKGLTSVTIPNSVTSIGSEAFENCSSLTSVDIPNSVTSIGDNAFGGCSSLTNIDIPNSVTRIGHSAFTMCNSLSSVTIPNTVTSIGRIAFQQSGDTRALKEITFMGTPTFNGFEVFRGCINCNAIYYRSSEKPIYDSGVGSTHNALTSTSAANALGYNTKTSGNVIHVPQGSGLVLEDFDKNVSVLANNEWTVKYDL